MVQRNTLDGKIRFTSQVRVWSGENKLFPCIMGMVQIMDFSRSLANIHGKWCRIRAQNWSLLSCWSVSIGESQIILDE